MGCGKGLLINTMPHIQGDLYIHGSMSDRIHIMTAAWFYDLRYANTEEVVCFKNAGQTNRLKNRMGKAYVIIVNSFQVPAEDNNESGGNDLDGIYMFSQNGVCFWERIFFIKC